MPLNSNRGQTLSDFWFLFIPICLPSKWETSEREKGRGPRDNHAEVGGHHEPPGGSHVCPSLCPHLCGPFHLRRAGLAPQEGPGLWRGLIPPNLEERSTEVAQAPWRACVPGVEARTPGPAPSLRSHSPVLPEPRCLLSLLGACGWGCHCPALGSPGNSLGSGSSQPWTWK